MNATTKNVMIGVVTSVIAMAIFQKFFDKPDLKNKAKESTNWLGF